MESGVAAADAVWRADVAARARITILRNLLEGILDVVVWGMVLDVLIQE